MKLLIALLLSVNCYASQIFLGANDMSASFNTSAFKTDNYNGFNIHMVFSGAPVGTIQTQFSNDLGECSAVTNWIDVDGADYAVSAAGQTMQNFDGHHPKCVRVKYTRTSGSGTATITVEAK